MNHRAWSSTFVLLALATATLPLAAVSADTTSTASPNGYVIVAHPRSSATTDGGVVVNAVDGNYVFDVDIYDAHGNPFPISYYVADLDTEYGNGAQNSNTDLVWTSGSTGLATPSSHLTLRIPSSSTLFRDTAIGGAVLVISLVDDAAGRYLCTSAGDCPRGEYSLAANEAAAQGRWAEADQADQGFTPIFLLNDQPTGLLQIGNPVLNPGFEASTTDPTAGQPTPASGTGSVGALTPPWVAVAFNALCPETRTCSHFGEVPAPASDVDVQLGGAKTGNGALRITWNSADAGRNAAVGQVFNDFEHNGGAWVVGADGLTVDFDMKLIGAASASYSSEVDLHTWTPGAAHSTLYGPAAGSVSPADGWKHFSVHVAAPAGDNLTNIYFPIDGGFHGADGTQLLIDNVAIRGANFQGGIAARNDLADGYTTTIVPLGAAISQDQSVKQNLVHTAAGDFYAYIVGAKSYLGGQASDVAVGTGSGDLAFQLLNQNGVVDAQTPRGAPVFASDNTGRVFRVANADGSDSGRVLVLAPADVAANDAGLVPWAFVNVPTDGAYTDTFGANARPTSGYYSPARNNLQGFAIADQMDYQFTPIALSSTVGPDLSVPVSLFLSCPGASGSTQCNAQANPVMHVGYKAAASYAEPVTLTLETVGGTVLASATISSTQHGADLTITQAQKDAMQAAGDMRVVAKATQGTFVTAATSNVYRLDTFPPVASYTQSITSGITRLSKIVFKSTSTDSDGHIVATRWTINSPTVNGIGQSSATTFTFQPKELGTYTGILNVTDDSGAVDQKDIAFTVGGIAPVAAFTLPAFAKAGAPLVLTDKSTDQDGRVLEWALDVGDGNGFQPASTPLTVTLPTPGVATIALQVTDNDHLVSAPVSHTVVVDGTAPTTTVTVPATPSSGWYTGNVTLGLTRQDPGADASGVKATIVTIDNVDHVINGSAPATINVTGDGVHTVVVKSVDNVGNVELAGPGFVIQIDTTAAETKIVSPSFLGGFGGAFSTTDHVGVSVSAKDLQSGVGAIWVKLDAEDPVLATLTANGPGTMVGTVSFSGLQQGSHQIQAWSVNGAGLESAKATTMILAI